MPGNEVGDRVHNFFDQGSLSQDQCHSQLVEGNWPVYNNNLWNGSERQIAGTLNSSSKNYNAQQSDVERGQGNQFSMGSHGFNFVQSNVRPEFVKNSSQLNLNGYMHSPQIVPSRQNEANFLGVNTESDRHNLTSRGLSILESQQRTGLQHANSASFGGSESPLNFNFLGSQQQMSGQAPGRMQSLPRSQSPLNDAQLMQQQVMMKQMQERQQQLHQLESMHRNAANPIPTFPSQMDGQRTSASNGNPLHNAPNYPWPSQVMAGNANWPQLGPSSTLQGNSNGLMITPEQGQTMCFMSLSPQQASHSLYGVPVSNSRTGNFYSHNIEKPGVVQAAAPGGSFSGNQYSPLPGQLSMHGGTTPSRSVPEGKSSFEHGFSQSLANMVNAGSFNQTQQRNMPISEGERQGSAVGSERVPGKSFDQPPASESSVGLDPSEEKFLFGNDESIWEAFGGSSSLAGTGLNRLDGPDLFNGVQSGTWSALMQSAVGETSSGDTGMQEELGGLGSQNSRLQSGYQPPSVLHDNKKQQSVTSDSSQMGSQAANNDVRTTNYFNNSGLPQSFPHQTESHTPQEGRKWLDCNKPKSYAEPNHAPENAISSHDCSKTDMDFNSHRRSTFLPQNSGQPSSRLNLNFIDSVPENGGAESTNQDTFHDNFRSRSMSVDAGYGASKRLESVPNSSFRVGSPHVNAMDAAVAPSLSNNKTNHEHTQMFHDSNRLDLWKPVNSSVKFNMEGSDRDQHNLNKGPSILDSSTISDHGFAKLHETDTGDLRESLNDNHRSGIQHRAPLGGLRENVWLNADERPSLSGSQENSSYQSVKKPSVTRKFQYHPMGDVDMDVESAFAEKHDLHSQPMSQHLSSVVKGHETQPRFLGPQITNSMSVDKSCVSSFQGAVKMSHGVSSGGVLPGFSPNTCAPFMRSGEISSSNQHVSSSQNMLDFLHKVDQSKKQNAASHLNLSDSTRLSDIASHGTEGLNQSQSSTSHGFNLQLAPPTQGVASPNLHAGFQSFSKPVDSPSLGHLTSDKGDKAHAWLGSVSTTQCLPPSPLPPQMQSGSMDADGSLQNLKGKLPAPSATFLRNPLNQHLTAAGGKTINDKSAALFFDRNSHHDHQIIDPKNQGTAVQSVNNTQQNLAAGRSMNQSGMRALMNQMPAPPAANMSISRKDNLSPPGANMWISQPHLLGAQGHASETSSSSQNRDEQDGPRKVVALTSQGAFGRNEQLVAEVRSMGQTAGASQEEEPITKSPSDASPSNSSASQKDVEAFHQPLKSNYTPNNSHSLSQMQAMRSTSTDSSHRESKRLKGSDDGSDTQQAASDVAQAVSADVNNNDRDPSVNHPSVSAGNSNMLSFAPQSVSSTTYQFPHGAVGSQDTVSFARNDSQNFTPGNLAGRIEYAGISPQMAPSWFEQYGTLKNGQLLRIPVNKNAEHFVSGTSNNLVAHSSVLPVKPVDTGRIANSCQTASAYTPGEHVSSLEALPPHVPAPNLATMKHKKRKTATSDLLPWNIEVGQGIKRLQNMSLAEMDWAQSSNRLVEKVEDETDNNEDLMPTNRPKRRLILTTQLTQQMLRPPSAAVLSLDASSNYEVILYSLARLALGDACSQICCVDGDLPVHLECRNPLSEKVKTSERIRDQYFSKVMEDFITRAKELKDDLERLDKRASILDLRLDCQDLERFSVINRFARFHNRSQVDGAETSSSSDAAMSQKFSPQRYVSAHPMPRNVPERVQCLSL